MIQRAVYDVERGMGAYDAVIDEDAADFLADMAGWRCQIGLKCGRTGQY